MSGQEMTLESQSLGRLTFGKPPAVKKVNVLCNMTVVIELVHL